MYSLKDTNVPFVVVSLVCTVQRGGKGALAKAYSIAT